MTFDAFQQVVKHCHECLIYLTNETKTKEKIEK